jgi:lysophospholipase L1-like esterase
MKKIIRITISILLGVTISSAYVNALASDTPNHYYFTQDCEITHVGGCITIDTSKKYNVAILGDSYSAGNGAGMYYHHEKSYRSHRNWGNLYTNWLRSNGVDAVSHNLAYSGNETEQVLSLLKTNHFIDKNNGITIREIFPENINLVLMTIGGNDARFDSIVRNCLVSVLSGYKVCEDSIDYAQGLLNSKTLKDQTHAIFRELQKKLSKDAKVVLLGYPLLALKDSTEITKCIQYKSNGRQCLKSKTYPAATEVRALGLRAVEYQHELVDEWNAQNNLKVEFVSTHEYFAGHEPIGGVFSKNPKRWINGILETEGVFEDGKTHATFSTDLNTFYHPNVTGHQKMFEALRNKISKPAVEPNEGFEVVTEDTVGDLFSKFNSLFSEQKAYADEIPEDITELKKYITESEYLLIDGNMIAKEDIGTYIFINYGSLENYKKHLEQNGEEIVKIGDRDLIDLFKNDVEQARLESLKLQSPERNSSSDAPKNSQTAQEVKDSQSEISQVSPKSGSNSQTKTSPNSAQSQAASQSESTKPQSQASSSAQPKFTESKNATNPQSDNSNERPTSSNNLPLIFTLAGGIILSVMAFVALKKR